MPHIIENQITVTLRGQRLISLLHDTNCLSKSGLMAPLCHRARQDLLSFKATTHGPRWLQELQVPGVKKAAKAKGACYFPE